MSVISSNDSHLQPHLSSVSAFVPLELFCLVAKPGCIIFNAFLIANILLLLPLLVLILRHGFQQRFSSSPTTVTHSDTFTYHLVSMELIHIFGCILCCCGNCMGLFQLLIAWFYLFSISLYGEGIFHILTCLEHYLAVVHPITYLSLKRERWIRIRSITIGFIWLLNCGLTCLNLTGTYLSVFLCLSTVSVVMISFCCLSVLCALIHSGPGERGVGGDRVRIHQSKQRAFYTIVAILGVLMLRCVYILVWCVEMVLMGHINNCALSLGAAWIYFPGSLVSPLLYLQKNGMLGCRSNRKWVKRSDQ